MKIPVWFWHTAKGAVAGAIAATIVGFWWGGWVTGSSARDSAQKAADTAVIAALAPVCVERFRSKPNADASIAKLKAENEWRRADVINDDGSPKFAGYERHSRDIARACATTLTK